MELTTEELHIKHIEGAIIGLKNGTKTPATAGAGVHLNKLKDLNPGMHEELMRKYKGALAEYHTKYSK